MIWQIRRRAFYAVVCERPWSGKRKRTPWATNSIHAKSMARDYMAGGYLPIYMLVATPKPKKTQEET